MDGNEAGETEMDGQIGRYMEGKVDSGCQMIDINVASRPGTLVLGEPLLEDLSKHGAHPLPGFHPLMIGTDRKAKVGRKNAGRVEVKVPAQLPE
eukprot:scaffold440896_cov42-Prasinocladus_malaysianus.AAC.1